jgi:hypothetical protein
MVLVSMFMDWEALTYWEALAGRTGLKALEVVLPPGTLVEELFAADFCAHSTC